MSKSNKLSEKARTAIERAKGESENLNTVIAALVGALMAKRNVEQLDLLMEDIFVNSDPSDVFEGKINTIECNDDGTLFYTDDEEEDDGDLDSLPLNTRIELAEKLADLLES
jgi:hypothetical protein